MRNPQGYASWSGVEGTKDNKECDTITCAHCNTVVNVPPPPAPMTTGFCRQCMDHICGPCADLGSCTPFLKKIEQAEARERFLRSI